jgi:hypothetical protein
MKKPLFSKNNIFPVIVIAVWVLIFYVVFRPLVSGMFGNLLSHPSWFLDENPVISLNLSGRYINKQIPEPEGLMFKLPELERLSLDCTSIYGDISVKTDTGFKSTARTDCSYIYPFQRIALVKKADNSGFLVYTDGHEKKDAFSEDMMDSLITGINRSLQDLTKEAIKDVSWQVH